MVWVCGWLHIFAQCKQQTADMLVHIYLRVCMYCIVDTNWHRPAIVPPMVYLHLTQAGAWCEMWFICAMLRPVLWRQRFYYEIYWAAHNTALLTTSSTHCFVAVLLMWLKTPSLWHPQSFPFGFIHISSHYRYICHCFCVIMFQVIFSSAFSTLLISSVVEKTRPPHTSSSHPCWL